VCARVSLGLSLSFCAFAWLRFGATGRVMCASATGITWTSRTLKAEFGPRDGHTSVVDAAGAIYVIGGGIQDGTYFNDVWASTDGGARPDSVGGGRGGALGGYYRGTQGTQGYSGGFKGELRVLVRALRSACARACACTRVCAGVHASARASVFCRSIGKHLRAWVCAGVPGCVCACGTTACVCLGGCAGAVGARRRRAV
jgi:hypothetical protein